MKIAFWNSGYFSGYGGAEFHTAEMINALARRGETCFLLADAPDPGDDWVMTPELDDRVTVFKGAFQNPLHYKKNPIRFL